MTTHARGRLLACLSVATIPAAFAAPAPRAIPVQIKMTPEAAVRRLLTAPHVASEWFTAVSP